jgi:hypothetical protein
MSKRLDSFQAERHAQVVEGFHLVELHDLVQHRFPAACRLLGLAPSKAAVRRFATTGRVMAHGTTMVAKWCGFCADICHACAAECSRFSEKACQDCAAACRRCAQE